MDPDGIVRGRFFEVKYWNRMTMPAIFWRLSLDRIVARGARDGKHLGVRTATSDTAVSPGNRFTLVVDIEPLPGLHVYAPDVGGSYQGLDVHIDPLPYIQVHEPVYPLPAVLRLLWTDETLSGYAKPVRVTVDVSLATRMDLAPVLEAGQGLHLSGRLRLQACDDRVCWPPETIPLTWTLDLRPPDLDRVPEAIQHKPRA
ncbi:MAG: protein-disulfide reductase DsbD domain-containing protein [bacterium]